MMGTIGGIFAKVPLAILVNKCGWQLASLILAAAGVFMTIIAWGLIRDHASHKHADPNEGKKLLHSVELLATKPQVWLIACIGALLYMPISAFTELWVEPYLMQLYDVNNEIASSASTMIFLGFAIGGPVAAWLSERKESRILTLRWSAIGLFAAFLAIVLLPVPLPIMFALMFLAGLLSGGEVLTFSCVKEMFPNKMSGAAVGFTNAVVMMSGVVYQPLLGGLLDIAWDGELTAEGIRVYSTEAYQLSMLAIPITLAISWILMQKVRETYGHQSE
jgi:sugar phosphate permease